LDENKLESKYEVQIASARLDTRLDRVKSIEAREYMSENDQRQVYIDKNREEQSIQKEYICKL